MNQTQLLRRISGIARLEQACVLSDFVRELALKNITKDKNVSTKEARKLLEKRLAFV